MIRKLIQAMKPFPNVDMGIIESNPIQVEEKKLSWEENIKHVQPQDVFIASYPRSGNTWLRMMLVDVFWQLSGNDTRDKKLTMLYFSPTIDKLDLSARQRPQIGYFLLKTHIMAAIGSNRFIFCYRNPVDSIVSHYRFAQKRPIEYMEPGLEEYCNREVEKWIISARMAFEKRHSGLVVSYEDMLSEPRGILKKACQFLGLPATPRQIDTAVSNQSMSSRRKLFESRGMQKEISFSLAHGKSGAGNEYISKELADSILKKTEKHYKRLQASRFIPTKPLF